jgi:hypothetical protein
MKPQQRYVIIILKSHESDDPSLDVVCLNIFTNCVALQPKFLSKAQREKLALEKRAKEVEEMECQMGLITKSDLLKTTMLGADNKVYPLGHEPCDMAYQWRLLVTKLKRGMATLRGHQEIWGLQRDQL